MNATAINSPTPDQREALRQKPNRPHVMYQTWRDLLFLHWRVAPEYIQATLPAGLYVDTYDDAAYLGVVPFYMAHVRPRLLPPLPWLSYFPEMNLRTYVHDENGTPGVWFYTLDAMQPIAVNVAQQFFHLPYVHSRISLSRAADESGTEWIHYSASRQDADFFDENQTCQFKYRGDGSLFYARPGTLPYFLAERYLLFARIPGRPHDRLATGRVWHTPYPLEKAVLDEPSDPSRLIKNNASVRSDAPAFLPQMPAPDWLNNPGPPDLVHYSQGVNVKIYPLQHSA